MFDSIKQKLDKINKFYLTAAVLGVSAIGAYYFYGYKSNQSKKEKQVTSPTPITNAPKTDIPNPPQNQEKALVKVINRLKKMLNDQEGGLGFDEVVQIYKSQFELSKTQFKEATLKNRRERRKHLQNILEYNKIFSKYTAVIDKIHNTHLDAVLAYLKIEKGAWMELTEGAAAQNSQTWDELLITCEQEELDSLRDENKPKLKLQILIEIQKYRAALLKEHLQTMKGTIPDMDTSDVYNLVEKWAVDKVFNKYRVEQEDINYSQRQLSEQEKEQIQNYNEEVRSIMQSLILAEDELNDLEQN